MKPSEVLERSRSAAIRIRAIDTEIRELHDRIGVQGHTYGFHGKNDIRDPMRKVDEMIDGTIDLETERMECQMDISEAWRVIDGLCALDEESSRRFTIDSEYVLTEYYVYAMSEQEISKNTGYPANLCMMLIKDALGICDRVGFAGLNAARNRRMHGIRGN